MSHSIVKNKQPLTILELAEAALLGDLALGLQLIGWLISIGALVQWLSVIPFALITVRHRKRATYFAMASTIAIAILIGGATLALQVYLAGILGAAVGISFVKRKKFLYTTAISLVKGAIPVSIIGDLLLVIFVKARKLTIAQIRVLWNGIGNIGLAAGKFLKTHPHSSSKSWYSGMLSVIHRVGAIIYGGSRDLETLVKWMTANWYLLFPISVLLSMLIVSIAMDFISRPILKMVLKNLRGTATDFGTNLQFDPSDDSNSTSKPFAKEKKLLDSEGTANILIKPVPVILSSVSFKYNGSENYALKDISMQVDQGELIGVVGENGSGKSTLGKILLGLTPCEGSVIRPGKVGLGKMGGTSVIFQRPESQVLGSLVEDDIVWGLEESVAGSIDIDKVLSTVGLAGFRKRETSQLSGGELQRLALAAALSRDPKLLISDESTALLDPLGRHQIVKLLKEISVGGSSVVHISHLLNDLELADKTYLIENGKIKSYFSSDELHLYKSYLNDNLNEMSVFDNSIDQFKEELIADTNGKNRDIKNETSSGGESVSELLNTDDQTVNDADSEEFLADQTETNETKPISSFLYEFGTHISRSNVTNTVSDLFDYSELSYEDLLALANSNTAEDEHMTGINYPDNLNTTVSCDKILSLINVGHVYLDKTPWATCALQGINIDIESGESIMIVGDNGSGKTTLGWILSGLLNPTEGEVVWDQRKTDLEQITNLSNKKTLDEVDYEKITEVPDNHDTRTNDSSIFDRLKKITLLTGTDSNIENAERISNVPKSNSLKESVPAAIVFQHAIFQLTERNVKNSVKPIVAIEHATPEQLIKSCLKAVGFVPNEIMDKSIFELSGGEIRRVAIASVLALMPKLIIFDEPLAGLDFGSKLKVRNIIASLHKMGIATVVVTHDYEELFEVCSRVIHLSNGTIVFDGASAEWKTTRTNTP